MQGLVLRYVTVELQEDLIVNYLDSDDNYRELRESAFSEVAISIKCIDEAFIHSKSSMAILDRHFLRAPIYKEIPMFVVSVGVVSGSKRKVVGNEDAKQVEMASCPKTKSISVSSPVVAMKPTVAVVHVRETSPSVMQAKEKPNKKTRRKRAKSLSDGSSNQASTSNEVPALLTSMPPKRKKGDDLVDMELGTQISHKLIEAIVDGGEKAYKEASASQHDEGFCSAKRALEEKRICQVQFETCEDELLCLNLMAFNRFTREMRTSNFKHLFKPFLSTVTMRRAAP
jgi:hypothetical protein